MTKLTLDQVKTQALRDYNLVLVSSDYKTAHTPLCWHYLDDETVFKRSWVNIKAGYLGTKNVNNYKADKLFIETFKGLGYKLEQNKEQYLEANRIGAHDRVFILSNERVPGLWKVTKSNFERSAETHLNNSGMNLGELLIYSILVNNNIEFKQEYLVEIDGDSHIFDFYLPEYNLYIEYDGIQHYKSIGYFGGKDGLDTRMLRDSIKDSYVKSQNAKIVRIPYTYSEQEAVMPVLEKYIGITLKKGKLYFSGIIKEVAEYYKCHSSKDTCAKFNLNRTTVNKYYKLLYGKAKVARKHVTS